MKGDRRGSLWAGAAAVVVMAALAAAFVQLGSPAERRRLGLDEQRVERLQELRRDVEQYLEIEGRLPSDFRELAAKPWAGPVLNDPVSHRPFTYEVLGPRRYRLCAEFERPSRPPRPDRQAGFWEHPAGRHCYEMEVEAKGVKTPAP